MEAAYIKEYCIDGITANSDTMEDYVNQSVGIITAINPHVGYEKLLQLLKSLRIRPKCSRYNLEENILSEQQLDQLLDPFAMTSPGIIELTQDE